MKAKPLRLGFMMALFTLVFIMSCGNSLRQFRTFDINSYAFEGEDIPSNSAPMVSISDGHDCISAVSQTIRLNGQPLPLLAGEINRSALDTFQTFVNALRCDSNCKDWILGMRIIYAQENTSLILYYQPVLLCAIGDATPGPKGVLRHYSLCQEGAYYAYANGHFNKLDDTGIRNMNAAIDTYKKTPGTGSPYGVEIKSPGGKWESFATSADNDPRGNVKSLVYPIKQMMATAGTGTLKIWNMVERIGISDNNMEITYHKHELLLSNDVVTVNGTNLETPSSTVFSDLSHICPPSCNGRTFSIYIIQ